MKRLKSRKLIEQLFKSGKSFSVFPFRVFYKFVKDDVAMVAGFGVSAKNFRKAVARNRIKRLTREAYRLQRDPVFKLLDEKKQQLALFFVYTGKELPAYHPVKEKMTTIMKQVLIIINETDTSAS